MENCYNKAMAKKTKIIIVGNGFGGTYTLKNLHKFFCGDTNVEIILIGEKNYFLFTPLLHEVATGGINPENIVESIRKVLGCCLSEFYLGRAEEINLDAQTVKTGPHTLAYDFLVLAPGAETNFYDIPGAKENTFTLKSLEDAIKIKNHIIAKVEEATHMKDRERRKAALNFMVVGGGPTGVELAAELEELIKDTFSRYYEKDLINDTSVILVQKGPELLPQFGKKIRQKSLEFLTKKAIKILLDTEVKEVGPAYALLSGKKIQKKIQTETIIWVAGVKPVEIKFNKAVLKEKGRLVVNLNLQLENHPEVFALGDVAAFRTEKGNILPMLAQVASKEGEAAAKNIYLLSKNKKPQELRKFKYRHTGDLISLGEWMAIGQIANFTFWGRFTWWLWRTVYLSKLISFRKRMKVAFDWTVHIFSARDISEF